MTDAEHRLWRELRAGRFVGAKFRRQEPIGRYIADFVSFEHKLIVEADGGQHAGSARDADRDAWFAGQGFRTLRFWNDEILRKTDSVLEAIHAAVESSRTLSPTPLPSRERGFGALTSDAKTVSRGATGKPLPLDGGGVGERVRDKGPTADSRQRDTRHGPPRADARGETAEMRLYGMNACLAAFAARPQDLRKVYLSEARIGALRDVLAWCVKHRLGYRVVETADLDRLAASTHHEGVVFDLRRPGPMGLDALLASLAPGPQVLLWLDGVGNPHNFGAVLRSAAHFGVAGVLLPADSSLSPSGAAARVAEGGAEVVPVLRIEAAETALLQLRRAGFTLAATLPRGGDSIYAAALPERLVLVFGAEGEGMRSALVAACDRRLSIPGSGRVESLNIANAVGVMLGECWRQQRR
jgi:TrmH RNA methyltransferase